jgi:3-hydroxybutyryl-CoA dehydrogenase
MIVEHLLGEDMSIKTIAVIGAGQMGNGIAQVASSAGFQVVLIDMNDALLEKAMATIQFSLGKLVSKEKISQSEADDSIARISTGTDRSLCQNADLVVEAIPEVLEWKLDLFRELDSICPDHTILASNTSSISITKIAGATQRPDRVIGMHFMNPVPLMKLVEIINGEETSAETNATIVQAAESMGKVPLTSEDFPGFISNRILCPMLNEAIFCLQEGVATREAIDGIMKLGMNHPMGPLALADYIGLDTVLHIMDVLYDGFGDSKYRAAPLLRRMVDAGLLGKKTGRGFYTYD